MKIIVLIGKPGSGKGTLSDYINLKYKYVHISMGDLLREESIKGTELGKLISSRIDKGNFAGTDICNALLVKKLDTLGPYLDIIVDGYPRDLSQFNDFVSLCENIYGDISDVSFINLRVSDSECKKRLKSRFKTSERVDDNEEFIKTRFDNYYNLTNTMLLKSRFNGYNILTLDGEQRKELVFNDFDKLKSDYMTNKNCNDSN